MKIKLAHLRQRWDKLTLTKSGIFWVAAGAIILTLYLGFSQAGWVTARSSSRLVEDASSYAVTERLAPICMAQFDQDLDSGSKLVEMKELTSSVRRTTFVKDQGWATMPGESDPDSKVATECARQLYLMGE